MSSSSDEGLPKASSSTVDAATSISSQGTTHGLMYPPTQTEAFLKCPMLWDYSRRWLKRGIWTPHAAMGTALGMACDQLRRPVDGTSPEEIFTSAFSSEWASVEGEIDTTWTLDECLVIGEKVLKKVRANTMFVKDSRVLYTQKPLGPQNPAWFHSSPGHPPAHSIADAIHLTNEGVCIVDDKFSLSVPAQYVGKRLAETEVLWQLWQYAYLWNQFHAGEKRPCTHIQKHLMVGHPSPSSTIYTVTITPERMERFAASAQRWWLWMGAMEGSKIKPMNLSSCLSPWRCEFYEACHILHGDEKNFGMFYNPRNLNPVPGV